MITLKSCPVCEGNNIKEVRRIVTISRTTAEIIPGVKIEALPVSHYFQCQECQLIFQNPRFSDSELEVFYSQGYYRRMIEMDSAAQDSDELNRAEVDAKIIKEKVGEVSSHLDIGASLGYLLDLVGAKIKVGIEAEVHRPQVNGVKVYRKISDVPQESFDLVTAIHVLEHVSKPLKYLQTMTKFIGRDGNLVIEVPTWKSPGGPLRLAHIYHFEPDVLKLMCKQVGLRVIHEEFTPHLLLICKKNPN